MSYNLCEARVSTLDPSSLAHSISNGDDPLREHLMEVFED